MSDVKIRLDLKKLPETLEGLQNKALKKAVATSIRRTFVGVRKEVSKEVGKNKMVDRKKLPVSKLKQRYFREQMNVSTTQSIEDMNAIFGISPEAISLINFFARRVQTGTTKKNQKPMYGVTVKTFGKSKMPKGAFIARGRAGGEAGGKEQVFIRVQGRMKSNPTKQKIKKMWGPSLSNLFSTQHTSSLFKIQSQASERIQKEFQANLAYFLSKL